MNAEKVGAALRGCNWVGIPFGGSLAEVPSLEALTILVNDLHAHIINLARVAADPVAGPKLYRRLRRPAFHPHTLAGAQRACLTYPDVENLDAEAALDFAEKYFLAVWMGRSGKAGTKAEFSGNLPIRWSASGGDSNTRFRSAAESLRDWCRALRHCNFYCLDWRAFLCKCLDKPKHGIYCDPPFPGEGEAYRHQMTEQQQRNLAALLTAFKAARVVCRFYDHPLIRELYTEDQGWRWEFVGGRDQANQEKPEFLIIRN